jgi:hypothetical protein
VVTINVALWRFTMNTKSFLTVAVASALSLLPISFARGQAFEITDILKTGVAPGPYDIRIDWAPATPTPAHYTVEHTADLMAPRPWSEDKVLPATTNWTHTGAVPGLGTPEAKHFYRVWDGDVGVGTCTNPVGFVKVTAHKYWRTMMSVPLLPDRPGTPPDMRLADPTLPYTAGNLHVGFTIAEPLPASTSAIDIIIKWNPGRQAYEIATLYEFSFVRVWWDHDNGVPSGMELRLGDGFWLDRGPEDPADATIVFLGWVPTEASRSVDLVKGLTMFNCPYPTELKLNDPACTLKDVGCRGTHAGAADVVYEWHPDSSVYTSAFLLGGTGLPPHLEGKWWDDATGTESDLGFKPGGAMWYLRRSATVTWNCAMLYSL